MLKHSICLLTVVCLFGLVSNVRAQERSGNAQAQQPQAAQQSASAVAAEPEAPRVTVQAEGQVSVLRLMKFSGLLRDRAGNARTGAVGLTFALYKDQQGGSPLWLEVQNAQLDEQGRYTVLLGSTKNEGLPLELFSSGEARWLGVQANLPDEEEQPRVLLVSVPYALKAADAETLGGKPPSAFLLAEKAEGREEAAATAGKPEADKEAVKEGPDRQNVISGTVGKIAKFVGPNPDDVGNSVMTESGGNIGVDNPSPTAKLDVSGLFSVAAFRGNSTDAVMTFSNAASGGNSWDMVATATGSGAGAGKFSIAKTGVAHYLTIDGMGNVGVNNTSPGAKLDVTGTFGVAAFRGNSTDALMTFSNAAAGGNSWDMVATATGSSAGAGKFSIAKTGVAHYLTIDGSGNVGVNNTSPAARLDVAGGAVIASFQGSGTDTLVTLKNVAAGGNSWDLVSTATGAAAGAGKFTIAKSGVAHYLAIDGSGNVGIGTTAPGQKLTVAGTIESTSGGFKFPDSTVQTTAGGGDITGVVASIGLIGGATSGVATLELSGGARSRGINYLAGCDSCGLLTNADDQKTFFQNVCDPVTINTVTCFSDAGSPVINIQRQVGVAAPADVISGGMLTCSTTGASGTIVGAQSVLNTNDKLDFVMVTAGGVAKRVTVVIKTTLN